jgi:hypothetical protein
VTFMRRCHDQHSDAAHCMGDISSSSILQHQHRPFVCSHFRSQLIRYVTQAFGSLVGRVSSPKSPSLSLATLMQITADGRHAVLSALQVVDDDYRKALALPTDRFATNFNLAEHGMLAEIKDLLMPDAPQIHARLHKLNVYEPGGFFKEHKVHDQAYMLLLPTLCV